MSHVALHLVVTDPVKAAEWYVEALGAEETYRLTLPSGSTITVELKLGETVVAVAGEYPARNIKAPVSLRATSAAFHVQVPDTDAAFARAVAAGATEYEPVKDAFWGERTGQVLDPFGHRWAFDQRIHEVSHEEMARRAAEFFGGTGA
jgi:PhnB protein